MNTDKLIRLLRLTAENTSPVIQELRREIQAYVNKTEVYISTIEMERDELAHEVISKRGACETHQRNLIRIFNNQRKGEK